MITDILTTTLLAIAGVVYLVIVALAVRRHSFWGHVAQVLALNAGLAALWVLVQVSWRVGWLAVPREEIIARVPSYGALVLAVLFLYLTRSFLRLRDADHRLWLLGLGWIAVLSLFDSNVLRLPETLWSGRGWEIQRPGAALAALVVGWALFLGGAAWLTLQAYRRTHQPLHRNRIKYWVPTLGFIVLGDGLLFSGDEVLGNALHLLGLLLAAYVTLIPRPLDVRQMVRRVMSFFLITLLTVTLYTVGFMFLLAYFFQVLPQYSFLLAGATMAVIIAIFFDPLLGLVQKRVNRLIAGAGYDPTFTVGEYGMRISNILELERLATVALDLINETLRIQHGGLFLVDHKQAVGGRESFHLRAVRAQGLPRLEAGILSAESPVAQYLRQERLPLTQYDIDLLPQFRDAPEAERVWLHSLNMDVYVPIYAKGRWIGLLAVGPKVSGDRYFDDDLALLNTLADQTAVALENARLVENLVRLNRELREAYDALDQVKQQLEHLDRTKSDFITIASHELRTPLTLVLGYSQILAHDPAYDQNAESLKLISSLHRGAARMQEIVESMLDMASIDSRTLRLQRHPIAVRPLIQAVCQKFDQPLRERKLTLELNDLDGLPEIEADPEALGKVFHHLITNAIKYTPDGGRIAISGSALDGGDPQAAPAADSGVEIVIHDTGIGIDPRFQELIFTKFYQTGEVALHSSGKTKFKGGGPGLGLTIARGIVEAHGGKLWAESPGYDEANCPGSTFHVILPLRQQDPRPAAQLGGQRAASVG